MTVETEVSELAFTGDGANKTFPISFPIQQKSDLVVTLLLSGATVPTTLVLGTDYDVAAEGPSDTPYDASNVVTTAAPAVASTLTVARTVPIIQDTSLRTAGEFSAKSHEDALDYRTYVEQELARRIGALEALATLLDIGTLGAQLVSVAGTTQDPVEDTDFSSFSAQMPVGFVPTLALVGKVSGGAGGKESVMIRDWAADGTTFTPGFITGLEPGTDYDLSVLLLSVT